MTRVSSSTGLLIVVNQT